MEAVVHSSTAVLRLIIIYRPPQFKKNGPTATVFFNEFADLLERYPISTGRLLILGDFNFHVDY